MKIPSPKIILWILLILLISCKPKEPSFLTNFIERDTWRKKGGDFRYTKQVTKQDLDLLMATNEVNVPVYNIHHKYFYVYKQKLNERYYLLSFADIYEQNYKFTHVLGGLGDDLYLCIYDLEENKVVSKLRVKSADPIVCSYTEENYTYTVTSSYFKFNCGNEDCSDITLEDNEVTHTYKIIDNRFQLIDNK